MSTTSIRSIGAKTFAVNIELLKWSNQIDLVAISNSKGEVIVQRLNWQNLWVQPPLGENIKVCAMDWHPEERILAVGYSNGTIVQIDVENQCESTTLQLESGIVCLSWTHNTKEFQDEIEDFDDTRLYQDAHEIFLPSLPSFHSLSSNARRVDYDSLKPYATSIFNILIVGLKSGVVQLFVFGVLSCGRIDVAKHLNVKGDEFEIVDANMSVDFQQTFVMVKLRNRLRMLIFESEIFPKYMQPLLNLATKHGQVLSTMEYISDIIECITEAWETALLEMDTKLTKYVDSQPEGVVSADFLELLLFGFTSESLEHFLTRDLTEKGLKKLGNSIEISYSTIQELVVKPLHTGLLHICFYLSCVKGMSRNTFDYRALLGSPSNEALHNTGAFLIKSLEVQQAIEQSTRDYKIFWGWLYGVIIRLMEESVPDDVAAVTQQDIIYLADFLSTFDQNDEVGSENTLTKRKFNLERVGQYLEDKNLQILPKANLISEWTKLLDKNECLRNCEVIFPHHKNLSLVQEHKLLQKSITELFSRPEKLIGESFRFKTNIDLAELTDVDQLSLHHINIETRKQSLFTATVNQTKYFMEFTSRSEFVKLAKFQFLRKPYSDSRFQAFGDLKFHHSQFYNETTMSMLLDNIDGHTVNKCFIQFPIQNFQSRLLGIKLTDHIDIVKSLGMMNLYELLDPSLLRMLETSDGHIISVSGSRKTASILSDTFKRVRHYELEVEDDDDDDDEIDTSTSLDLSKGSSHSS